MNPSRRKNDTIDSWGGERESQFCDPGSGRVTAIRRREEQENKDEGDNNEWHDSNNTRSIKKKSAGIYTLTSTQFVV